MLVSRWIVTALVLGVALVVWAWVPRAAEPSHAAQQDARASIESAEEVALDVATTSTRAPVESAVEGRSPARSTNEPVTGRQRGRMLGFVRGLAPLDAREAAVVCESFQAGRLFEQRSTIGADGTFSFDGVDTEAVYRLLVITDEWKRILARRGAIAFAAGEEELYVALNVGERITRLVVRVRDDAGKAVPHASVFARVLELADHAPFWLTRRCVEWADADGVARFASLPPHEWILEVHSSRFVRTTVRTNVRPSEENVVDVVLQPGRRLSGRLRTASGKPVWTEHLTFTWVDPLSGESSSSLVDLDAHGEFVLDHAPRLKLTPQTSRNKERDRDGLSFGERVLPAVRPEQTEVELIVPDPCTLVGRVVGASDARELRVSARFGDDLERATVTLGPTGHFTLPLESRTGPLRLHLEPTDGSVHDHARRGKVIETEFPSPGDVLDIGVIVFDGEPVLRGIARFADGEAAAETVVSLEFVGPDAPATRGVRTDESGRFEFEEVPRGPGVLRIDHATKGQAELRLEDVEATARGGELALLVHPPARVIGRVHWNRSVRARPPSITVVRCTEFGVRAIGGRTVVREDGEFELTAWPGSYEVWLQWLGEETPIRLPDVTLEFGGVRRIEWTLD